MWVRPFPARSREPFRVAWPQRPVVRSPASCGAAPVGSGQSGLAGSCVARDRLRQVACQSSGRACTFAGFPSWGTWRPDPPPERRPQPRLADVSKVAKSATCKGVCPLATSAHDLPGSTSDETRSSEAALPARLPDRTRAALTVRALEPEPPGAWRADSPPPVHPEPPAPTSPPPTRRPGDHAPAGHGRSGEGSAPR